jgi:hypothetical protein
MGGLATAAHDFIGVQRLWRLPHGPLRVVITGGSSGVGKALAREFLRYGCLLCACDNSIKGLTCKEQVGAFLLCALNSETICALVCRFLTKPAPTLTPSPPGRCGDRVMVTSRTAQGAQAAMQQLREEVGPDANITGTSVEEPFCCLVLGQPTNLPRTNLLIVGCCMGSGH